MAKAKVKVNFQFLFSIPVDDVLEVATRMARSSDPDQKIVGEQVVEVTEISLRTQAAVAEIGNPDNHDTFDVAVYLDHDLGDSLEAAHRLSSSSDKDVKHVADTLISQADAIQKSKASMLNLMAVQKAVTGK